MPFQMKVALAELVELADTAESAARCAELTTAWLPEDHPARAYVDEARAKFNQALSRINDARFAIENAEAVA